jgi:hypothetical protein
LCNYWLQPEVKEKRKIKIGYAKEETASEKQMWILAAVF